MAYCYGGDKPVEHSKMFKQHNFATKVSLVKGTPTIFVTPEALSKMWHFVDIAEEQVAWLGTVSELGNNLLIEDVYLLRQELSATKTEITSEGLSDFVAELATSGVDTLKKLCFWGVSHGNKDTQPEKSDIEQFDLFSDTDQPYFIRGILNKNGKMTLSVMFMESGIVVDDCEWTPYSPIYTEQRSAIETEFEEKVQKKFSGAVKISKTPASTPVTTVESYIAAVDASVAGKISIEDDDDDLGIPRGHGYSSEFEYDTSDTQALQMYYNERDPFDLSVSCFFGPPSDLQGNYHVVSRTALGEAELLDIEDLFDEAEEDGLTSILDANCAKMYDSYRW